jgi:serine/threonine-protein phosphatase 2A activator
MASQTGDAAGQTRLPPSIPNLRDSIPKLQSRRRAPPPENPLPVPSTPVLPFPPDLSNITYTIPTKRILSPHDHDLFLKSPTYDLILAFVFGLTDAVEDAPISKVRGETQSETVKQVLEVLDWVEDVVKRSPPEDQGDSRFGNKGFLAFLDLVAKEHQPWHKKLGITSDAAIAETSTYFLQSFGNRTRIDYGSGHELNFFIWLLCLYQLGLLKVSDFRQIVLVIFVRYLKLMRLIQSTYYLEPAGSHGVWGLDDYQFLPFLFGSSQLLHHPVIRPKSIHQNIILEDYGSDYIYLDQVNYINSVKNVEGLRWHSPMLDDISAAKSWEKVEGGMRRMFVAEVLKKLPVMQHFLFGSLVPAVEGMSLERENEHDHHEGEGEECTDEGHDHSSNGANSWGDCCGIKVPSSVAAAEAFKKKGGENLRRIPFD